MPAGGIEGTTGFTDFRTRRLRRSTEQTQWRVMSVYPALANYAGAGFTLFR
ncbi:MAG: hypothetical protein ACI9W6_000022 [Motiliproteus sp.]|jgi:hypothetical protein